MGGFGDFWALRPIWITIIALVAPSKLLFDYDPELEKVSKCAYGIIVMAILWITEAIPIPVTALLPVFLFPMLTVLTPKDASSSYITDTSMLFLGGLIVAVALEESGLHKRISLLVMRIVGAKPMWLMFGLMVTTWFLSMWISNTAASSMMIPIISAVLETVKEVNEGPGGGRPQEVLLCTKQIALFHAQKNIQVEPATYDTEEGAVNEGYQMDDLYVNGQINADGTDANPDSAQKYVVRTPTRVRASPEEIRRLSKAFALCVAYGANIGGIATLTGTPPNLVLKDHADKLYAEMSDSREDSGISFAKWMGFAFPMSLLALILSWIWLQILFLRGSCFKKMDPSSRKAINATILRQYKALGTITFAELEVLVVFFLLVILWLFRDPPNIDGWGIAFLKTEAGKDVKYASDSTPSILLSVLLFILPAERPKVFCWSSESESPSYKPILTWKAVSTKLPWGVMILLGGGFALAKASSTSGLSTWVGEQLEIFKDWDMWLMNLMICVIVAGMTELTSNTATATLLMPIMSALAISIDINPLYLMMSATVACSFAFMLPVATPPNAIVFSTGYLTVIDMVIAGFPMNIITVLCLTLAINTWGKSMYDLDTVPDIFKDVTTAATTVIAGFPMNIITVLCLTLAINTWGKSMYDLDTVPDIFKDVTTAATTVATTTTTALTTITTTTTF